MKNERGITYICRNKRSFIFYTHIYILLYNIIGIDSQKSCKLNFKKSKTALFYFGMNILLCWEILGGILLFFRFKKL